MGTSEFGLYLRLGLEHILDLGAYDHILFVIALAAVYSLKEWKHMLVLVTAFTTGHSITLALATLGILVFNESLIETLIPITIVITAALNVFERLSKDPSSALQRDWKIKYGLALFFGLIHGLGFSYYLRAILGGESSIVLPLFSFNVGLELGQLVILVITLSIGAFLLVGTNMVLRQLGKETSHTQRNGAALLSAVIAVWALTMI
jgi:hypothetical protein